MDPMKSIIPNMISPKKGNQNSKFFQKYDVISANCKQCGKETETYYKMLVPPDKTIEVSSEICFFCQRANEDKQMAKEAWQKHQEAKQRRFIEFFDEHSLINPKLRNVSFQDYAPTNPELEKAKLLCMRYSENFKKDNPVNLMLFGSYGVGKSHMAVSIVKSLIAEGFTALFISTPKLLAKLRATYNKESNLTESQLIQHLNDVDCLVIDDLGAEKNSDWASERLFEIIDGRAGKHTIYTTNFKPEELKVIIGPRNFSRVMDDTHLIPMNGKDHRLKKF